MKKILFLLLLLPLSAALAIFIFSITGKPADMTWQDYAIMTGDPSKCNKASYPDVCRAGFTQATGDRSACAGIKDAAWKQTCEAYSTGATAQALDFESESGDCRYDSECPPVCEGNVAWKQGCNPREGKCFKTFDTDCTQYVEKFGSNSFPETCSDGVCVRNVAAIELKRNELESKKESLKQQMGESSTTRANLIAAKDEANRNCLGGLSDATVILMNELATKTAGLLAGGVSVVKDATNRVVSWTTTIPDYIGTCINEMQKAGSEEQTLSLDQYIALNCQLNSFFGDLLDESNEYIDSLVEEAKQVDSDYEALP